MTGLRNSWPKGPASRRILGRAETLRRFAMIHTGRCFCGEITFEFDAEPVGSVSCHCRDCQYAAGGHPSVAVVLPTESLRVLGKPTEFCSKADSGAEVCRTFCPTCGTPLFARNEHRPEQIAIKLGALDSPEAYAPAVHIWTDSAQPWHHIAPDKKQIARP